jgi:protein-L-isoaspartate(D-aspartate) O-methyltransferase
MATDPRPPALPAPPARPAVNAGAARRRQGALAVLLLLGGTGLAMSANARSDDPARPAVPEDADLRQLRLRMVEQQIRARGIDDERVLAAMAQVPRHLFVPEVERRQAYEDHPLPIGSGQTISQPYVVALMTSLLALTPQSRVLEIGTGSGYQAAVLSRLAAEVYSVEIVPDLAARALGTLARLGYDNIHVRIADGYRGWSEAAPFDAIVLTAAPREVPQPLLDQLRPGGRLVLPVGGVDQDLVLMTKGADGSLQRQTVIPVRFVPMTGEAQRFP